MVHWYLNEFFSIFEQNYIDIYIPSNIIVDFSFPLNFTINRIFSSHFSAVKSRFVHIDLENNLEVEIGVYILYGWGCNSLPIVNASAGYLKKYHLR